MNKVDMWLPVSTTHETGNTWARSSRLPVIWRCESVSSSPSHLWVATEQASHQSRATLPHSGEDLQRRCKIRPRATASAYRSAAYSRRRITAASTSGHTSAYPGDSCVAPRCRAIVFGHPDTSSLIEEHHGLVRATAGRDALGSPALSAPVTGFSSEAFAMAVAGAVDRSMRALLTGAAGGAVGVDREVAALDDLTSCSTAKRGHELARSSALTSRSRRSPASSRNSATESGSCSCTWRSTTNAGAQASSLRPIGGAA